ncbi:MAG: non-ribosomal peptide synthetase, partial [bacterium]|nr:non-ribosomal peptide synthetase [bacterium]
HNHYNQSILLFRSQGFNKNHLETVFHHILRHHDALRIIFPPASGSDRVRQFNRGITGQLFHLETHNFDNRETPSDAIHAAAQQIQESIDLQTGPLVRLGLFQTKRGHYLLIAIHHLVMDGVSWRILLQDLDAAYRQLEKAEDIQFPPKTDSFLTYSRELHEYARRLVTVDSRQNLEQHSYWQQVRQTPCRPLPVDFDIDTSMKRQANLRRMEFQLDTHYTQTLLTRVHQAYNTRINDILLAALALALNQWAGLDTIILSLEGHGRDFAADNLDISRTIGWFTTRFPLVLETESLTGPGETLKSVKEALRRVPDNGIGYGVMTYLLPPGTDNQPPVMPEISFNYLGQFENESEENDPLFTLSGQKKGDLISPQLESPFKLDLNSIVTEGRFSLTITYNHLQYQLATIEKFSDLYKNHLIRIINHCTGQEESEATPSDLGAAELSIDQLDDIKNMLEL